MAEVDLNITFDGPGIVDGRMGARDLAASLIAVADLMQAAQAELFPHDRRVTVDIKATDEGSFEANLVVLHTFYERIVNMFSSDEIEAALNLGTVVGGVGTLLALLKRRARARVVSESPEDGGVRVEFGDGTAMHISREAAALARNVTVRKAARQTVEVLERPDGVTSIKFESSAMETVEVGTFDIAGFDVPEEPEEPLGQTERDVVVTIASAAFADGTKWRLSDGESTFWATIADQEFLERVDRAEEIFAKHDLLRVRLRTEQVRTTSGLRAESTVVKVWEHIEADRPMRLPFGPPPA